MDCTQKMVASLWRNALVWCSIVYTLPGYSYYLQSTQRWIRGYWPEAKRWKHFALAKRGSSSQKTCMHLLCSANATRFFAFCLILWQTHDYNLFRAVSQLSTDLVEVEQQTFLCESWQESAVLCNLQRGSCLQTLGILTWVLVREEYVSLSQMTKSFKELWRWTGFRFNSTKDKHKGSKTIINFFWESPNPVLSDNSCAHKG